MKKHLNIKIFGKVQDVSFRYYTEEKANELVLAGFVRNEKDGTVYIEAEGEEEKLKDFLKWCRQGPRFAKVADVEVNEGETKGYTDFSVKY